MLYEVLWCHTPLSYALHDLGTRLNFLLNLGGGEYFLIMYLLPIPKSSFIKITWTFYIKRKLKTASPVLTIKYILGIWSSNLQFGKVCKVIQVIAEFKECLTSHNVQYKKVHIKEIKHLIKNQYVLPVQLLGSKSHSLKAGINN